MTTQETPTTRLQTLWQTLDTGHIRRLGLGLLSYILITFGQPAYSSICSIFASTVGFSIIFYELTKHKAKMRFLLGASFFFLVQCVELFWFTYHPVVAVRSTFLLLALMMGLQFGFLSLFITKEILSSRFLFLLIPALWTLLEWSRIYWCSGFYFDLVGLSLAGNIITLQTAALFGTLGMSFWVMLTNAAVTRAYILRKKRVFALALIAIALPYLYGSLHFKMHSERQASYDAIHPLTQALIVHSKKVPEEFKPLPRPRLSPQERAYIAWKELLKAISPYYGKEKVDLILMPEGVVPYGSNTLIFETKQINRLFQRYFKVPYPKTEDEILSSEDIGKEVAKLYNCPLIIGLEGVKRTDGSDRPLFYNSAFFFSNEDNVPVQRYDKQVLVPMGEYIPFNFAKKWAAKYGIYDSFTPGDGAKPFKVNSHKIGASICYEETVGSLMRQNSVEGATLLVNLTDDYWFPYSMLAIQHYEHSRPRTVENGVPLLRACNFGISGAIDSLGREVCIKEGTDEPSSFIVNFSSYHYSTLYGRYGDLPILLLSSLIILIGAYRAHRL